MREAERTDVNNVDPQAEAVIDWIAFMLQERTYRRVNESMQNHNQRLKQLILPHRGESEALFRTRLAARWQQPNETSYEFAVRMKDHHARVCVDNGPMSAEDEEWKTLKTRFLDLKEKLPLTLDRFLEGFKDGGEYNWRFSDLRAQLWHFESIGARKRLLAERREIWDAVTWGGAG